MNPFKHILNCPDEEKLTRGVIHTPAEIAQQPEVWRETAALIAGRSGELLSFLQDAGAWRNGRARMILTGAGSSEFVGTAVAPVLSRQLSISVASIPTTHIVTHPQDFLPPERPILVVSFARSGNSPESVATFNRVKRLAPQAYQLIVTCNREGELATIAEGDDRSCSIILPEATHDHSLVMTSSYSSMVLAALGLTFLDRIDGLVPLVQRLATAASRIIEVYSDTLSSMANEDFDRACFLGAHACYGMMQECHLKMQEMTDGHIAAVYNTFLGLRHGPQVFVNDQCIVLASLSSAQNARRYEIDLLRELETKGQGRRKAVICDRASDELKELNVDLLELWPEGDPADDDYRAVTDVVAGQILGLFTSLKHGLKPDAPSVGGTIHRVVDGVTIYD